MYILTVKMEEINFCIHDSKLQNNLNILGICYIVVEKSNKPELIRELACSMRLNSSIILQRRAGREFLMVMKLSKSN